MKLGKMISKGRNASVYEWSDDTVIKLFNKGISMQNEYENTQIINSLNIPSPKAIASIKINECDGIIFERIDGNTMTKSIEPNINSLEYYAKMLANLQVMVNNIKVNYKENLKSELINNINSLSKLKNNIKNKIIEDLLRLEDKNELCHYDLHPDNIIISNKGPIIIDWANVLVGNSLADVARTSIILQSTALPPIDVPDWIKDRKSRLLFHEIYLNEYYKLKNINMNDLKPWLKPLVAARLSENIEIEESFLMLFLMND